MSSLSVVLLVLLEDVVLSDELVLLDVVVAVVELV
jgi:hypothetical protein